LVIRQVEVALRGLKISFDSELLKSVENWFKQVTKESEDSVNFSLDTEAAASLGAEAPFLAKLLFN
jgi:hypothetical protein